MIHQNRFKISAFRHTLFYSEFHKHYSISTCFSSNVVRFTAVTTIKESSLTEKVTSNLVEPMGPGGRSENRISPTLRQSLESYPGTPWRILSLISLWFSFTVSTFFVSLHGICSFFAINCSITFLPYSFFRSSPMAKVVTSLKEKFYKPGA